MAAPIQENRRYADNALLSMIESLEEELKQTREVLTGLQDTQKAFMLGLDSEGHRKQHEYLDTLIQKEKDRASFRRAVIEKTLVSLLWSILVGLAISVGHYFFPDKW